MPGTYGCKKEFFWEVNLVEAPKEYVPKISNCKVIELECDHYVHDFEYERISMEMKSFIEKLNETDKIF